MIIAPLSIVGVWQEELQKFADFNYTVAVLSGTGNKKVDTLRHMAGTPLQIVRYLKKYILLVSIMLLLILGFFIYKNYKAQIEESDIIIEVNKDNLTKTSEENVLNFYEKNRDDFKTVANYLLANEKLFGTRPVILNKENSTYIEKMTDETIKKMTNKLFKEGIIKQVSSLNDDIKNVNFSVNGEYGIYEQGIRYVSDTEIINKDKTKYNYVKEYKDLGNGWFYYLYYYNEIKEADVFRKIAWDRMSENEKNQLDMIGIKQSLHWKIGI